MAQVEHPGRAVPGRVADEPRGRRRPRARAGCRRRRRRSSPPTSSSRSRRPLMSASRTAALPLSPPLLALAGCGGACGTTSAGGASSSASASSTGRHRHRHRVRRRVADRVVHRARQGRSRPPTRAPRSRSTSPAAPRWPTQITQGAPADVFASASPANMEHGRPTPATPTARRSPSRATAGDRRAAGNPAGVTGLADLAEPGAQGRALRSRRCRAARPPRRCSTAAGDHR